MSRIKARSSLASCLESSSSGKAATFPSWAFITRSAFPFAKWGHIHTNTLMDMETSALARLVQYREGVNRVVRSAFRRLGALLQALKGGGR